VCLTQDKALPGSLRAAVVHCRRGFRPIDPNPRDGLP
jgi:hypothetical protein